MVKMMVVTMAMAMKLWQVLKCWYTLIPPKLSVSDVSLLLIYFLTFLFIVQKQTAHAFGDKIQQTKFYHLLCTFLYHPLHNGSNSNSSDHCLLEFHGKLSIYPSAVAIFLHPVTSVVLVGCIANVFMLCHHGDEAPMIFVHTNPQAKSM